MEPILPQEQPSVEYSGLLSADVDRVKTELEVRREGQEDGRAEVADVKEALVATLPQATQPAAPITASSSAAPTVDAIAAAKVMQFTQLALEKGILAAHAAAKKEEPFIIDALHDALAGQLYDELHRRGEL